MQALEELREKCTFSNVEALLSFGVSMVADLCSTLDPFEVSAVVAAARDAEHRSGTRFLSDSGATWFLLLCASMRGESHPWSVAHEVCEAYAGALKDVLERERARLSFSEPGGALAPFVASPSFATETGGE